MFNNCSIPLWIAAVSNPEPVLTNSSVELPPRSPNPLVYTVAYNAYSGRQDATLCCETASFHQSAHVRAPSTTNICHDLSALYTEYGRECAAADPFCSACHSLVTALTPQTQAVGSNRMHRRNGERNTLIDRLEPRRRGTGLPGLHW